MAHEVIVSVSGTESSDHDRGGLVRASCALRSYWAGVPALLTTAGRQCVTDINYSPSATPPQCEDLGF